MKERYRLFSIILYKESESYDFSEVIKNIKGYKFYAYCKHDLDITSEGLPKKIHYHIVLKLDNASTITALSKKIGVPENYIQNIKNERSYIRYLIHFDDEDKAQYNFEDIHSSRCYQRFIKKCFEDKETEEQIISNINNFINSLKGISYSQALFTLIAYVNDNAYDTIYKRYRNEFTTILKMVLD